MNIEIANRLYEYRKNMGLTQEELAEKIGVSRQAVSKWERSEASPDTDNLIELSKVYGVTLDELLKGKEDEAVFDPEPSQPEEEKAETPASDEAVHVHAESGTDKVDIGLKGIHINSKDGTKVSIDKNGIFVSENGDQKVYTDVDGHIHRSEEILEKEFERKHGFWMMFPYPFIAVAAYLAFGFLDICGGWEYGWLVFLTIPLYYTLVDAIQKKNASHFAYPVLVVIAFLICGLFFDLWHPAWVLFLTVPLYYIITEAINKSRKK
ncbi:MAG: helix-turn-helix transcriptional regulator [Ruminococcus sp.]|nr:helix-turn-helix transcriptional regulator [Ruminococcus sp.]